MRFFFDELFIFIEKLVHSWCTKKSYPVVQVKMIGYDETTGERQLFVFYGTHIDFSKKK
jgi:hypothetical protein